MKRPLPFFVVGLVLVLMYSLAPTFTTVQAQTSITAAEGTPTLDGVESPGEWTSSSITTGRGLTLKAMIDSDRFYVLATWPDVTESVNNAQWTFDGTNWSQSGDEDRVTFVWDMGLSGADGASCQAFCHPPDMSTNTGRVDVWHWKANRFNPMGFSDDKWWFTDGRHGDDGAGSGASNKLGTLPAHMAATDPGANVTFLTDDQDARSAFDPFSVLPGSVDVKVPFDAGAAFSAGNVIPGRILTIPTGNHASVQAAGKWANGMWTVEFSRKLAAETGANDQEEDFNAVRGGSVQFTTDIFDDLSDHGAHAFSQAGNSSTADTTVYTLIFPPKTTVLIANFMNGNNAIFNSRVYLSNSSNDAGDMTVRVFTLPLSGGVAQELTTTPLNLGTVEGNAGFNIKVAEDILAPLGISLPYTDNGGNLTLEFTIEAENIQGVGQVFSSDLAFGTYPLQKIPATTQDEDTALVANFTNGNNADLNSRVYLFNSSQLAGDVNVWVFTLPLIDGASQFLSATPLNLGSLGPRSALNIKLAEDILTPLGISLPYTDNGGNLTIVIQIGAPNVRGVAQVFSSDLAFGTYPLQGIE
jgi:hypothetical protein